MVAFGNKPDPNRSDAGGEAASDLPAPQFPPSRKRLVIGIAFTMAALAAAYWYLQSGDNAVPAGDLALALKLLDDADTVANRIQAREIARELEKMGYRDPEFAGASEFILGITAFRDAATLDEVARDQTYRVVVHHLREAERLAVVAPRRPEWAYALGVSLQHLGYWDEAQPLLAEAVESFPPGRVSASLLLTSIYLEGKDSEEFREALALNTAVLDSPELDESQRDRAFLQRAAIYLHLGQTGDAQTAFDRLGELAKTQEAKVLQARIHMAAGRSGLALQILEPVANGGGLERTYARRALYLMGVAALEAGETDPAINAFVRTAKMYGASEEAVAADLNAGDLLREKGRNEEALEAYRRALGAVQDPDTFRNRWLTLDEFRRRVEAAWRDWLTSHEYDEAIALSKLLIPLFRPVPAYRLTAETNRAWAEHLEAGLAAASYQERIARQPELFRRWSLSGQAHAALATALRTEGGEALWTSAEHFRKGRDFESALEQLTKYIEERPGQPLPAALLWRGKVLMHLDRMDEAREHFEQVIAHYPTDLAAFEAQFALGRCYLEQDHLDRAERAWRDVLESPQIDPKATEWRLALFNLGRLLYHTADLIKRRADQALLDAAAPDEESPELLEAFARWDESTRLLDEYLQRYPGSEEAVEARYLLAKGFERRAELPKRRIQRAETENARMDLDRERALLLGRARDEFRALIAELSTLEEKGQLDELDQRLLRNASFNVAHTLYHLGHYDEATAAYSTATHKYPQDPQVLLAYLQMTNCYDRLGKPTEARSMLEQANVIRKQLPEDVFTTRSTNLTRDEWDNWIQWAKRLHPTSNETAALLPE